MVDSKDQKFEGDLFKKYFKLQTTGGFIAVRKWLEGGKLSVDIGELAASGGLVNNTLIWTPVIPFATYLRSITNNTADRLYSATKQNGPESFIHYGGGNTSDGPISRLFKVAHWYNDDTGNSFEFKTGHFKATQSATGAFVPDMSKVISVNKIKVLRSEIAEMSYVVDLALQSFAGSDNWLSCINGKEKS